MAFLSIRNVAKSFGKNPVLRNISLEIAEGEFLTILGESGSGKTPQVLPPLPNPASLPGFPTAEACAARSPFLLRRTRSYAPPLRAADES